MPVFPVDKIMVRNEGTAILDIAALAKAQVQKDLANSGYQRQVAEEDAKKLAKNIAWTKGELLGAEAKINSPELAPYPDAITEATQTRSRLVNDLEELGFKSASQGVVGLFKKALEAETDQARLEKVDLLIAEVTARMEELPA